MTTAGMNEKSLEQGGREAASSSPPQSRSKLLKVLGIIATIMFYRHPAALSGAAGCFLSNGTKR
ncbi:hypothetical protein A7975_31370 [Bacillus sp. FJAT-26390]|nr:hypothetical protein A7975_31370 [Bacillus sp. FJAT-26390]